MTRLCIYLLLPLTLAMSPLVNALEKGRTPNRFLPNLPATVSPITIIDRETIFESGAISVYDVLKGMTGISSVRRGGVAGAADIYLRGSSTSGYKILIDGVPAASSIDGNMAWEQLPAAHVDRIEITRGPMSGLYGSNAISGVIQIFTRTPDDGIDYSVGGTAGSYLTLGSDATLGVQRAGMYYGINASYHKSDGYNELPGAAGSADDDGFENDSVSGRFGFHFGRNGFFDVRIARSEGEVDSDTVDDSSRRKEFLQQTLSAHWQVDLFKDWVFGIHAGQHRDERDLFNITPEVVNSRRQILSVYNQLRFFGDQYVVIGFDREDAIATTTEVFAAPGNEINEESVYIHYERSVAPNDIMFTYRHTDADDYESVNSGTARWAFDLARDSRVVANYGFAYSSPNFRQLYSLNQGNSDLEVMISEGFSVGLLGSPNWGMWGANYFQTKIDDDYIINPVTNRWDNGPGYRLRGFEVEAETNVVGWRFHVTGTYLIPTSEDDVQEDKAELAGRARQTVRVNWDRKTERYWVGLTLYSETERYDANTEQVYGGYGILNARLGYLMGNRFSMALHIDNAFDREYQTVTSRDPNTGLVAPYQETDRSFYLTLRYTY